MSGTKYENIYEDIIVLIISLSVILGGIVSFLSEALKWVII